jgi:L-fuconolactonase
MIDGHHHLWDTTRQVYPWMTGELSKLRRAYTPSDLQPHLAETGVVGTILVETWPDLNETCELMATTDAHEFIRGVVGWVDLTDPAVADTLAELRASPGGDKLVGIRHQRTTSAMRIEASRRGAGAAGRWLGRILSTICWSGRELGGIQFVRGGEARFVLEHFRKPPRISGDLSAWASAPRAGAIGQRCRQVIWSCHLGGLEPVECRCVGSLQPAVDAALAAVGADRLMFGSDLPGCRTWKHCRTTV